MLRFLVSPAELWPRQAASNAVRIEQNELVDAPDGSVSARGTGQHEVLPAGLVMRSIGYHGTALPGVPYDERAGVIPNVQGRVTEGSGGAVIPGVYAVGWIKRGPTGLIGTNKNDAKETADRMLEDVPGLTPAADEYRSRAAIDELLQSRGVRPVSFADWRRIDAAELSAGQARRQSPREVLQRERRCWPPSTKPRVPPGTERGKLAPP